MAFSRGQEAVSPVVGVVLLVAITVVLAAAVFFTVSRLNEDRAEVAPRLAMSTNSDAREATVVLAEPGLDWFSDMVVSGSCDPLLNGAAFPIGPGTPVRAGDVLSCQPGEELLISSGPGSGNALLYQNDFS